jgi:hypothetical protein
MNSFFLVRAVTDSEAFENGYPVDDWTSQVALYQQYDEHFSGQWLQEAVSTTNPSLKYPLQFDPTLAPIFLHTSFLYGEVPDGSASLVQPEVEIWKNGQKQSTGLATEAADKMTQFLRTVWEENGGRSKQLQVALDSQVYGGFVMGAFYSPERGLDGEMPLSIVRIHPADFYPVWSATDYDNLLWVTIGYAITAVQAKEYGVAIDAHLALYREEWTRKHYEITIDDHVVSVYGAPAEGEPPGGQIPFVYVPHPPRGSFYGTSLLKDRMGMAKEINARMVDTGDIISEEAANIPAVRNTREPIVRRLSGTKPVIDLGFQQGDRIPDIMYPGGRANSIDNASEYVRSMVNVLRSEMYCTPVLFGGDDGSQRSAASLALRSIPLIAHIREERGYYADGMARLNKTILRIAAEKSVGGITKQMAEQARVKFNWFPMLPRDAAQETTMIISRVQAGILSSETAIEMIGDVLDITAELSKIEAQQQKKLQETQQLNAFKGAGRNGELAGIKKPKTAKESESDE